VIFASYDADDARGVAAYLLSLSPVRNAAPAPLRYGAAETLLVDEAVAASHLRPLVETLQDAGCTVHGDEMTRSLAAGVIPATEADWTTEYLDANISVKVVGGLDGAIDHIARYGSQHTDAIVTADQGTADRFLDEVDSAIVIHNASTQFADGGEFGMGAEIGIATPSHDKLTALVLRLERGEIQPSPAHLGAQEA